MARTGNGAVSVSFFQKRICSCMVDPKMNQCADPIDTQHNVLFEVWRRNVPQWLDDFMLSRLPGSVSSVVYRPTGKTVRRDEAPAK